MPPFQFIFDHAQKNERRFPTNTTHLTFKESTVSFDIGAFTSHSSLISVKLPETYIGPNLNLVFMAHVKVEGGRKFNNVSTLYDVEKVAPLPFYLERPTRDVELVDGDTVMPGVCCSKQLKQLLSLVRYPHAADIVRVTGTLVPFWFNGTYKAVERFIAIALVYDGIVYDDFPVPCCVTTAGELLRHLGATDCVVTCNGTYANEWDLIQIGVENYYAVFASH